jgi:hypothetical protein
VAQSKPKSGARPLRWETVSYVTSVDGDRLIVEKATSSTSEVRRFTVLFDHGSGLDLLLDYLSTLSLTFSDTPAPRTCSRPASRSGKRQRRLA